MVERQNRNKTLYYTLFLFVLFFFFVKLFFVYFFYCLGQFFNLEETSRSSNKIMSQNNISFVIPSFNESENIIELYKTEKARF